MIQQHEGFQVPQPRPQPITTFMSLQGNTNMLLGHDTIMSQRFPFTLVYIEQQYQVSTSHRSVAVSTQLLHTL